MNKYSSKSAQGGFTLIELIVVIVILGILAATALPKFASLGGDARVASLQAARGALSATSAMVHGKYLLAPATTASVDMEGVTVTLINGYPAADAGFAAAAGLNDTDYRIDKVGNALRITPISVVGKAALENSCSIRYFQATATAAPRFTQGATPLVCE